MSITKEQKEAIEKLNRLKNIKLGPENRMGMIIEDFKSLQNGIELILNMLKEKDKEIENLKDEKDKAWEEWNNLEQGSYEEEKRLKAEIKEKDREIEKKDKIIYKMIDSFIDLGFGFEYCNNDDRCINDCDKCVKQYFEQKATNNG